MELGLRDKVVLITGAASGLGRCTVDYMLDEGARVLLADVNEQALATALEETSAHETRGVLLDVRDFDACKAAAAEAASTWGQLDVLVTSAGVGGGIDFFKDETPEDWKALIDINLLGTMNCCRAASEIMVEQQSGKIVALASEAGKGNEKRMAVYGSTKGAVISLVRGLALELGRYNINVNAVCPGVTDTPMIAYLDEQSRARAASFYPLGRLGRPQDIAAMITFLASEQASWVTGQAISVSGGFGRS